MRLKGIVGFVTAFSWGVSPLGAQRVSPLQDVTLRLVSVADSGTYLVYAYRLVNSTSSKAGAVTAAVDLTAPDQTGLVTLPPTGTFRDSARGGSPDVIREHVPVGPITPANWTARLAKEGWLYWSAVPPGDLPRIFDSIAAGESRAGFGLRSPFLPGIRGALADLVLVPFPATVTAPPAQAGGVRTRGWAVAPTYLPARVTLDVLRDLLDRSCGELAWITPADACDPLRESLAQAASSVRRGDRDGARDRVQAFLRALDENHGTGRPVSDNAYWLLRVDATYLAAHATNAVWLDPFPSWAVGELAALKGGATTADWMRAHPSDTLAIFAPPKYGSHDDWCARATMAQRLPDSSRVVRRAYFNPPPLTSQSALPTSARPEVLARRCVLEGVWVEVGVPTTADGVRVNADMGRTLATVYHGAQLPWPWSYQPPFSDYPEWQVAGPWEADSTIVLSAAETHFQWRGGLHVMALAYRDASGFGPSSSFLGVRQFTRDSTFVAEAAELTGLPPGKISPLVSLLARAETVRTHRTPQERGALRSAAVSALSHWLEDARPLEPARRAAAYLAADRLLGNVYVGFLFAEDEDTTEGHRPLRAWGAEFEERYMAGFVYTHSWLDEAVRLDPTSRAGTLAFMSHLGGCDPGKAIEQSEAFMPNVSDPALRAQLHFTLGDAYADSVGQAGQTNVDARYRDNVQDAPAARAKAIEHYRAGLATDRTSVSARAAWRKAWRLLAGQPPLGLSFHCEPD